MFGFGKKKKIQQNPEQVQNEKPVKKTRVDKLVMGAILGVAIGSVVGATMFPKKKKKDENGKNEQGIRKNADFKKIPDEGNSRYE